MKIDVILVVFTGLLINLGAFKCSRLLCGHVVGFKNISKLMTDYIEFLEFILSNPLFSVFCDRTKEKIYENVYGNMCFRRLNATHQTGCSCK